MNKESKLTQICLFNFKPYLEFKFLEEGFANLLPALYFDKVKQKLESNPDNMKYIYFIRKWFHKILYEREELIKIEFEEQKRNLYYNFYLNLLIKENPEIKNYAYSLDFIKEINIERKKTSQKYKFIMLSKIIIDLIYNYRGSDEYNENMDRFELEEIEKENRLIIKNNIAIFKEINLNLNEDDILIKNVDEIYAEIINALIRSKKVEDFEYAYNVFQQLDLKNIDLTKTIFESLMNGQNCIKDYEINNIEDLNDEKKVNFYYLLLEFIFKNSIYIYNVPFLLKAKRLFLELFKIENFKSLKINKKIEFIALKILDSKFYSLKYYENIYEILNEVLKYYEEYFYETKIKDIKIIKDIIDNKKIDYEKYEKYLEDYDKAKKIKERIPIINYIYNLEYKGDLRNEGNFEKAILKLDNFEKMIKERKIEKEYGEIMANCIKDENNNKILSKILNKNEYDYFINYIKESSYSINKNENIGNSLVKNNNNEKSNIIYGKPFENEEDIKDNITFKNMETNMSSTIYENSTVKKEENLDAVETKKNNTKENLAFHILNKTSIIFHTNFKGKKPYIIYDEILCGEHNIKIDY